MVEAKFSVSQWIRFPGHILSDILRDSEDDNSCSQDLASFNLNLGDYGQCRLVTSLVAGGSREESVIRVSLSVMSQDDDSEDVFSISGTMMIVDEEGGLVNQVRSDVAELIKIIIHEFDEISVSSLICLVCSLSQIRRILRSKY